jgi:hypothetical protein
VRRMRWSHGLGSFRAGSYLEHHQAASVISWVDAFVCISSTIRANSQPALGAVAACCAFKASHRLLARGCWRAG